MENLWKAFKATLELLHHFVIVNFTLRVFLGRNLAWHSKLSLFNLDLLACKKKRDNMLIQPWWFHHLKLNWIPSGLCNIDDLIFVSAIINIMERSNLLDLIHSLLYYTVYGSYYVCYLRIVEFPFFCDLNLTDHRNLSLNEVPSSGLENCKMH